MDAQEQYLSEGIEKLNKEEVWTSGEWIGEGQGGGPRHDTGIFHARQWVGEGQGTISRSVEGNDQWTSGEWIGEGQGGGPRHDTGIFHARQWVGNR